MLFNSFSFGLFLIVTFVLYWTIFNRRQRLRNVFLLAASYFFYGCWDWRFLFLIAFITLTDFVCGALLGNTDEKRKRKTLLVSALIINLGVLGFFKYFNFFIDSFIELMNMMGVATSVSTMDIVLPVGISFFTFQGLSYVLDIYYDRFQPTKDVVAFATFVSFFPQLVAGPIERAKDLLPQFTNIEDRKPFSYDDTRRGLFLIVIGLFKKMVIADRLAVYVDSAYNDVGAVNGLPALIAVVFFAFQLYLDFSAYSQIAIGTARIFGYRLSTNFNKPYVATSFKDFWSRWHITLTSWFRDYLYFPLGGNRKGSFRTFINVMIVFAVSGLWHGASWSFVIWGCLNGLALAVFDKALHLNPKNFIAKVLSCLFVVGFWTLSLIFFRASSLGDAVTMFGNLGFSNAAEIYSFGLNKPELKFSFCIIAALMLIEIIMKNREDKIENVFFNKYVGVRWLCYIIVILGTIYLGIYGGGSDAAFIYFQF